MGQGWGGAGHLLHASAARLGRAQWVPNRLLPPHPCRAANYALMLVAPAVGSVGLAAGLAAWVYEVRRWWGGCPSTLGPGVLEAIFACTYLPICIDRNLPTRPHPPHQPSCDPILLQRAAQAQGEAGTCIGPTCFRATFLALAAAGLLAAGAGVALYRRSSALYRRQASRFQAR